MPSHVRIRTKTRFGLRWRQHQNADADALRAYNAVPSKAESKKRKRREQKTRKNGLVQTPNRCLPWTHKVTGTQNGFHRAVLWRYETERAALTEFLVTWPGATPMQIETQDGDVLAISCVCGHCDQLIIGSDFAIRDGKPACEVCHDR